MRTHIYIESIVLGLFSRTNTVQLLRRFDIILLIVKVAIIASNLSPVLDPHCEHFNVPQKLSISNALFLEDNYFC